MYARTHTHAHMCARFSGCSVNKKNGKNKWVWGHKPMACPNSRNYTHYIHRICGLEYINYASKNLKRGREWEVEMGGEEGARSTRRDNSGNQLQKIRCWVIVLDGSRNLWANMTISGLDKVNPPLACVRSQAPKSSADVQKWQSRLVQAGFLADSSQEPVKQVSVCKKESFPLSSLGSGERDLWLSIDIYLWLQSKPRLSSRLLQSLFTDNCYVFQSPCQLSGPSALPHPQLC